MLTINNRKYYQYLTPKNIKKSGVFDSCIIRKMLIRHFVQLTYLPSKDKKLGFALNVNEQ